MPDWIQDKKVPLVFSVIMLAQAIGLSWGASSKLSGMEGKFEISALRISHNREAIASLNQAIESRLARLESKLDSLLTR